MKQKEKQKHLFFNSKRPNRAESCSSLLMELLRSLIQDQSADETESNSQRN
jgi:hypothetical protein